MSFFLSLLNAMPGAITQGMLWGIMAIGVYITYKVLDIADLTVDGSICTGAAACVMLMISGTPLIVAMLVAVLCGMAAGLVTGLFHTLMGIPAILSGILTQLSLYSINLKIAGGKSLVNIGRKDVTLFQNNPVAGFFSGLVGDFSTLVIIFLVVLVVKILLDLFLKTRAGYLLRAVGDNERVVTALACDKGRVKIIGLMIANAFAALSGAVLCQHQRMFEVSMGTGAMVLALASVIIGMNIFRRASFVKGTTAAIVGAIVYRMCVSLAIACGMGASDLKLITAVLFLIILAAGLLRKGGKKHA